MLKQAALFVPGNTPKMQLSADVFGADCLIFDLEDSVAIHQKDSARILVRECLTSRDFKDHQCIVRINPVDSPFYKDDLLEVVKSKPDAIMIPKATEAVVKQVEKDLSEHLNLQHTSISFYVILETAYGIETALQTCSASKRVVGLLLGGEDLCTDMRVTPTKERVELNYARGKVAMVGASLKIIAWDTPFVDVEDIEGFKHDTQQAKALGFTGKVCIHPNQVELVHEVFAFSTDEVLEAKAIIAAYQQAERQGLGASSYQGKMIDKPILERAKQIIASVKGSQADE